MFDFIPGWFIKALYVLALIGGVVTVAGFGWLLWRLLVSISIGWTA